MRRNFTKSGEIRDVLREKIEIGNYNAYVFILKILCSYYIPYTVLGVILSPCSYLHTFYFISVCSLMWDRPELQFSVLKHLLILPSLQEKLHLHF